MCKNNSINWIGIVISNFLSKKDLEKKLNQKKNKLIWNNSKSKLSKEQIINKFKNCNFIIAGTETYDYEVLSALEKLVCIIRIGVGTENIDLSYAKERNIKIFTTKELLSNSVAELIVYHILFLSRNMMSVYESHKPKWIRSYGNLIYGKNIGLIGYGNIGKKIYEILLSFKPNNFLIYDKKKIINPKRSKKKIVGNLKQIFQFSDIICINLPLTNNTRSIIDLKLLNYSKKNLILVNTSRAEIINKDDLMTFLKKNKNVKIGQDVFYNEPGYDCFPNFENVSYSSHIGSYTIEARSNMELEAINILIKNFKLKKLK